jgi:hypothetical protein
LTVQPHVHDSGFSGWRVAGRAGVVYTLAVFTFAFAVGAVRVTIVAPRIGALLAVALEAPIVLTVGWFLARWCTRRFNLGCEPGTRIRMGVVAFSLLMVLELAVATLAFGEGLDQYFAKYATAPGMLGLAGQLCFAAIPWLQCHRRSAVAPH